MLSDAELRSINGHPSHLASLPPAVNHTHACLLTEGNATQYCITFLTTGGCVDGGKSLCKCPGPTATAAKDVPLCPEGACTQLLAARGGAGGGSGDAGGNTSKTLFVNRGHNPYHFSFTFMPALVAAAHFNITQGPPAQLPPSKRSNDWNRGLLALAEQLARGAGATRAPTTGSTAASGDVGGDGSGSARVLAERAAPQAPPPASRFACYDRVAYSNPPTGFTDATMLPGRQVAAWFRGALYAHCGVAAPPPPAAHPYRTIVVADRPARAGRRFCALGQLVAAIQGEFPGAAVAAAIWGEGPLCQQAAQAAEGDAIVAVHGASLTRLMFAREGAVVVEVMPWGYAPLFFPILTNGLGLGVRHHVSWGLPHADTPPHLWGTSYNGSWARCMQLRWCYRPARGAALVAANASDVVWRLRERTVQPPLLQPALPAAAAARHRSY